MPLTVCTQGQLPKEYVAKLCEEGKEHAPCCEMLHMLQAKPMLHVLDAHVLIASCHFAVPGVHTEQASVLHDGQAKLTQCSMLTQFKASSVHRLLEPLDQLECRISLGSLLVHT